MDNDLMLNSDDWKITCQEGYWPQVDDEDNSALGRNIECDDEKSVDDYDDYEERDCVEAEGEGMEGDVEESDTSFEEHWPQDEEDTSQDVNAVISMKQIGQYFDAYSINSNGIKWMDDFIAWMEVYCREPLSEDQCEYVKMKYRKWQLKEWNTEPGC